MTEKTVEYTPNAKQREFHLSPEKFRAFIGGIGSGKTYSGAWETFYQLWTHPGMLALIGSPTYKMLRDSTMLTFLEVVPRELLAKKRDGSPWVDVSNHEVKLRNGSMAKFRSADDPEHWRGPSVGFVWLDEAALFPSTAAWDIAIGRLRQKNMPCRAIVTTTPKGFNWLYEVFFKQASEDHRIIFAATQDNAANLPGDYLKTLQQRYAGKFAQQELLGQFVGFEGLVYPGFDLGLHVVEDDPPMETIKRWIGGIDWGYTNPCAILPIGLDGDGRAYVPYEVYRRNMRSEDLIEACRSVLETYPVEMFYADPSEPALIRELNEKGIPVYEAQNDVMPGIVEVASRLAMQPDGRTRFTINRRCANTIEQFMRYRYAEPKDNKPVQEAPMKVDDHAMDALRYGLFTEARQMQLSMIDGLGGTVLW